MATRISSVTMPKWGIEMTEGTITAWRVALGARVARGEEILDVETEKIVNAVEAPAAGVLRRITAVDGETRSVGELIGVIADESVADDEIERFVATFVAASVSFEPAAAATAADAQPVPVELSESSAAEGDESRVSPIARRLAERLGIDVAAVKGTGRNGRVSKDDVEAFAARRVESGAGEAPLPPHRVPMSSRRLTIARRMQESKQTIPHYRLDVDVDFGALLRLRGERPAAERYGVNDYLVRAVALALMAHPDVNAQTDGESITHFPHADIAIAVAAEAGLVTPILRAADAKSLAEIAAQSRDLIARARSGALQREEITGGSFTISNLGMFGIRRFDAIINAPQVAILAVGAVGQRAVVQDGSITVADVATLTLSADHRIVDGAVGAAFLQTLRERLEDPRSL